MSVANPTTHSIVPCLSQQDMCECSRTDLHLCGEDKCSPTGVRLVLQLREGRRERLLLHSGHSASCVQFWGLFRGRVAEALKHVLDMRPARMGMVRRPLWTHEIVLLGKGLSEGGSSRPEENRRRRADPRLPAGLLPAWAEEPDQDKGSRIHDYLQD